MTKPNKTIFAGLVMMAALLSSSIVYNTAFAQEFERERPQTDRLPQMGTYLAGSGAAVSEDEQGWRSHFRMGLEESQTSDNGHTEYMVKRGVFAVGKHDQRHVFSIVSETWSLSVNQNDKSFDASGKVENQDGKVYDVEISGDKISGLAQGNLYYITGTATGSDDVYDLFYISAMIDKPSIQTASSGIQ